MVGPLVGVKSVFEALILHDASVLHARTSELNLVEACVLQPDIGVIHLGPEPSDDTVLGTPLPAQEVAHRVPKLLSWLYLLSIAIL